MIFWNWGGGVKGRLEFIWKSIPFGDATRPLQYTASGQTFHLPRLLFFWVVFSALLCCVLRLEMLSHSCASVCVSLCCIKVLSHSCASLQSLCIPRREPTSKILQVPSQDTVAVLSSEDQIGGRKKISTSSADDEEWLKSNLTPAQPKFTSTMQCKS